MRPSRDTIKARASAQIATVLTRLGIDVVPGKHSITLCNPVRGEKNPSLQIWLKPGFEGAWKDYGAGIGGDVFALVAYFQGYDADADRGFSRACDWLCAALGLTSTSRTPARDDRRLREQQRLRAQDSERATAANRRRALAIWLEGRPVAGSAAETYLARRGIAWPRLAHKPNALRALPAHRHRESGLDLPCLVALMQIGDGRPWAIHRTWLAPDGADKAGAHFGWPPQWPSRKIWPQFGGAIIALSRGHSALAVKEANACGIADTLVLAEGVEDGLSLALADPDCRVWAAGSIANLARVPVPPCASEIIVCADNDWGKAEAAAQLARGVDHLRSFGAPVTVVRSPLGKDANDLIRSLP